MSIRTATGGIKAIWSPHTGIVDWARVARKYGEVFQDKGGNIHLGCELRDFKQTKNDKHPVQIDTNQGTINVSLQQTYFILFILTCFSCRLPTCSLAVAYNLTGWQSSLAARVSPRLFLSEGNTCCCLPKSQSSSMGTSTRFRTQDFLFLASTLPRG